MYNTLSHAYYYSPNVLRISFHPTKYKFPFNYTFINKTILQILKFDFSSTRHHTSNHHFKYKRLCLAFSRQHRILHTLSHPPKFPLHIRSIDLPFSTPHTLRHSCASILRIPLLYHQLIGLRKYLHQYAKIFLTHLLYYSAIALRI